MGLPGEGRLAWIDYSITTEVRLLYLNTHFNDPRNRSDVLIKESVYFIAIKDSAVSPEVGAELPHSR